jgi:hypothetical protein
LVLGATGFDAPKSCVVNVTWLRPSLSANHYRIDSARRSESFWLWAALPLPPMPRTANFKTVALKARARALEKLDRWSGPIAVALALAPEGSTQMAERGQQIRKWD